MTGGINAVAAATFMAEELAGIPVQDDEGEELGVASTTEVVDSVVMTRAYFSVKIGDKEFFVQVDELKSGEESRILHAARG